MSEINRKKHSTQHTNSELTARLIETINETDQAEATARAATLREKYPQVDVEALVGVLIKQKCVDAEGVGPVTSSVSVIPDVGVFVSLLFDSEADPCRTVTLQAELLLEIAAVYEQAYPATAETGPLIMVTRPGSEANQLLVQIGPDLTPIGGSALTENRGLLSNLSGVATRTWQSVRHVVGRATGWGPPVGVKVIGGTLSTAERLAQAGRTAEQGVLSGSGKVAAVTSRTGQRIAHGSGSVAQVVTGAGRGVARSADAAAGAVNSAGKIAGRGVAAGAGKAGDWVSGAGVGVVRGVSRASGTVNGAKQQASAGWQTIRQIAGKVFG